MPSVLLGGLSLADPPGSLAVREGVAGGLPNHQVQDLSAYPDAASRSRAARRSAALVLTGTPFPRAGAAAAAVSAIAGRPLLFFGAAVGPVEGAVSQLATRRAVARARLLLLADDESATHLASAGAPTPMRISADPAWLGVTPEAGTGPSGEDIAVVVDHGAGPAVERALRDALSIVAGTGRRIRVVPWHRDDEPAASGLAQALNRAVPGAALIEPVPASLAEAARMFAGSHAVVTLRYRGLHAAAAAGVPVIAVSIDARMPALAARLDQWALSPSDLATTLPIRLERIGPGSEPDRHAVHHEIARARAGLRLLRLVLEPDAVPAADIDGLPLAPAPWL